MISIIHSIGQMSIFTSAAISLALYVIIVFVIAVCNEMYNRNICWKNSFVSFFGIIDLSEIPLHLYIGFIAGIWPISIVILALIAFVYIIINLLKFLAKKLVNLFVSLDEKYPKSERISR